MKLDVNEIHQLNPVDVVTNIGGLYHVANPAEILLNSYDLAKRFLFIQTVVSLANSDEDYFEAPAPGWTWGSRYSRESFNRLIGSFGWDVVDSHFNESEGNDRLEDRGSVYYLIRK